MIKSFFFFFFFFIFGAGGIQMYINVFTSHKKRSHDLWRHLHKGAAIPQCNSQKKTARQWNRTPLGARFYVIKFMSSQYDMKTDWIVIMTHVLQF